MSKEKTKVCKHCKEEIDAKAKVCPHCRKKQGGKLKWVIIIIIVLAVLGMAMGGGDDDSSSTDSQTKSTTATTAAKKETAKKEETKEKDSVKVGESFENDGLKVTAKKAEFGYDGGEYFTAKDGYEYVAVDFTCENIAEKGDKYVSVSDCECYADNSACEQQYIGNSDFVNTNLSPGKNVSFTAYYEVPKDAKKVILEYRASFWTDKKVTINLK